MLWLEKYSKIMEMQLMNFSNLKKHALRQKTSGSPSGYSYWIIDSGWTPHIPAESSLSETFMPISDSTVEMG